MKAGRVSIGILAAIAVASGVWAVPSVASANPPATAGYAGPARDITESPAMISGSHRFTSRNWDGYITYTSSESTDFSTVAASWIQPTVTCEAKNAWTVFWIGLDGWFNDTVEQGGTEAQCGAVNGSPVYSMWWEMYPTNSIQTVLVINPGDEITASVKFATATSVFTIKVTDVTTGKSFTRREQCASGLTCDRSSADVITEDVGRYSGSGYFPLADYGTMGYSKAKVTNAADESGSISASDWLNASVTESAGTTTYATVTPLSGHGSSFDTVWNHQ
jgi:hypothetical protein